MSVILGVAGAARNATVAFCENGQVSAVCERERVTRTRKDALQVGQLPLETIEMTLRAAGRAKANTTTFAVAEEGIELPRDLLVERVDHHTAHAATSFYTSPFDEAVVLV